MMTRTNWSADRSALEERLGMRRNIARRDFLNGAALAIAGVGFNSTMSAARSCESALRSGQQGDSTSATYPPLRTGLRGQYPDAVQEFEGIQNGKFSQFAMGEPGPGEEY